MYLVNFLIDKNVSFLGVLTSLPMPSLYKQDAYRSIQCNRTKTMGK